MKKIIYILLLFVLFSSLYADKVFFTRGKTDAKEIALSFDDGPSSNVKKILKILDEKDVKVTFFLLGTSVEERPEILKDIYNKGHELANHTYNHINFYEYKEKDKKEKIKEELLSCQDFIKDVTGFRTKLVRFPYGYTGKDALSVAQESNYKVINWTFGIDWEREYSSEEMLKLYLKNAKKGAIFLMHDWDGDGESKMVDELPKLIDKLRSKGYKFVTVGEMINKRVKEK